jgi:hypothetical protein
MQAQGNLYWVSRTTIKIISMALIIEKNEKASEVRRLVTTAPLNYI